MEHGRDVFAEKKMLQLEIEELEKSKRKFLRKLKRPNASINIPAFVYKTVFRLGFYLDILFYEHGS